jgi:hypothetical protein
MKLRRTLILLISSFFFSKFIFGQIASKQIEINSCLQYDNYPSFTIPFNSVMDATIKIKGTSWGFGANYKYSLKKNLFAKVGIGYYNYSFNNIQKYTRLFGSINARDINYPGGSSTLGYGCNKYWYNTIAVTIGGEKLFALKKNINFIGGFDIVNYYTFSQHYNIPGTYNDSKYKKTNSRYFGLSFNLCAGLQKSFGRVNIGPVISLPIFRSWKQDMVFPGEQNSKGRSKWLRGVGVGITCIYPLTKT